eukprot:TRINITY_DN18892_c0_g1_i1.p1 TRINITY_DN18892_c0_g1~~TRINITY_DN18892_c0_g1_i1.p1  ORF type:complete len:1092 (-),score=247.74 TRINITY_DN18892_c0_g1_i1:1377-4535(-)
MSNIVGLGKNSLVYGSDDAGQTINARDFQFNKYFKEICQEILKLSPHNVHDPTASCFKMIWGAADIEGHKVESPDGPKYYLLDFARLFPPENPDLINGQKHKALYFSHKEGSCAKAVFFKSWPTDAQEKLLELGAESGNDFSFAQLRTSEGFIYHDKNSNLPVNQRIKDLYQIDGIRGPAIILQNKGAVFVNLNRPERVRSFNSTQQQISGDAFCGFGCCRNCGVDKFCFHSSRAKHKAIAASGDDLIGSGSIICDLVHKWEGRVISPADADELIFLMHKEGINVRFLGILRSRLLGDESKHRRDLILLEMVARTAKRLLFQQLRIAQKSCEDGSSEAIILSCRVATIDFMNRMFGKSGSTDLFWEELGQHMAIFFPKSLNADNVSSYLQLELSSMRFQLFLRFLEQTGISFQLTKIHMIHLQPELWDSNEPFSLDDVPTLLPRIENFNSDASLEKLIRDAIQERARSKGEDIKNYLLEEDFHHEVVKSFRSTSHPSSVSSFFELARAYFRMGNVEKALATCKSGLHECESHGLYSTQYLEGLQTISQIFIETGSYDKATTYLETAVRYTQAVKGHHPFLGKMNCFLGRVYVMIGQLDQGLRCLDKGYKVYEDFYGESAKFIVPLMLSGCSSEVALKMSHLGMPIKKRLTEDLATGTVDEKQVSYTESKVLFEKITGVIKSLAEAEGIRATDWSVENLLSGIAMRSSEDSDNLRYAPLRRRDSETRVVDFVHEEYGSVRVFFPSSFVVGLCGMFEFQFLDQQNVPLEEKFFRVFCCLSTASDTDKKSTKRLMPTMSKHPSRSDILSAYVLFVEAGLYDVEIDGSNQFTLVVAAGSFSPASSYIINPENIEIPVGGMVDIDIKLLDLVGNELDCSAMDAREFVSQSVLRVSCRGSMGTLHHIRPEFSFSSPSILRVSFQVTLLGKFQLVFEAKEFLGKFGHFNQLFNGEKRLVWVTTISGEQGSRLCENPIFGLGQTQTPSICGPCNMKRNNKCGSCGKLILFGQTKAMLMCNHCSFTKKNNCYFCNVHVFQSGGLIRLCMDCTDKKCYAIKK